MNIADIAQSIDRKSYQKGAALLYSKHLLRMAQDEELVFNAEFSGKHEEIRTEISLYGNLDIETVYCNCGGDTFCPHVVATLIGAELMNMTDTDDLQSAIAAIQNG